MFVWSFIVSLSLVMLELQIVDSSSAHVLLNCKNSDRLCPGTETVTLQCTTQTFNLLRWNMGDDYEVDFDSSNTKGFIECSTDQFCGVVDMVNGSSTTSTLTFSTSLFKNNTKVTCMAWEKNSAKSCAISYVDAPSSPNNASHSINQSHLHITWSTDNDTYPPPLFYINITSPSIDFSTSFNTSSHHYSVNITNYEHDIDYIVTIQTVLCDGSVIGDAITLNFSRTSTKPIPATTVVPSPTISHISTTQLPYLIHVSPLLTTASSISLATSSSSSTSNSSTSSSSTSISSSNSSNSPTAATSSGTVPPTQATALLIHPQLTKTTASTAPTGADDDKPNYDSLIAGVIGGVAAAIIILLAVAVIIVAVAVIVIVIFKRSPSNSPSSNPSSNLQTNTDTPTTPTLPTTMLPRNQVTLAIESPPPLPERTYRHYINIETAKKMVNPEYEIPHRILNRQISEHSNSNAATVEYMMPIVTRFLVAKGNSHPVFV